jgi:membrane protein YqaA with SNARE-associated domain
MSRQTVFRLVALLVVVSLSIYIYSIRSQAERLTAYGYPGIFLIAFLSYATVVLPAPGIALVFTMGSVFPPIGVALAAGAGASLGELSGYLAGYSGQAVLEHSKNYDRLAIWMNRNAAATILILAAIPNPFFDLAGIAAGALKIPALRFIFWCWIGVTIKMMVFAFAGNLSLEWLRKLF